MNRITRIAIVTIATLPLAACATPKARLRTGLADAGLPERTATCMADYMAPRLSLTQLRRLQSLASVSKVDYRRITVDQYLHKVRALKDTELLTVTGKAALSCAL